MLRSFRFKIGLLSVCLSGGVLLAFGLYFSSVIWRIGHERLNHELRALADAQVRNPKPLQHWARYDASLQALYGDESRKHFIVRVADARGRDIYVSPQWPVELSAVLPSPPAMDDGTNKPPPPPADGSESPRPFHPPGVGGGGPHSARTWLQSWFGMLSMAASVWSYGALWMPDFPLPPQMRVKPPEYHTIATAGAEWRIIVVGNDEITLAIGMDLSEFRAEVRRFRAAFLVSAVVALLLLTGGGWLLAQAALRPVQLIARTTAAVTARRLDQRIPATHADTEFQRLINVINSMLERLERSYRQAVRFSADAAHELKTPLMLLQGELEQALQRAPDGSSEQVTYGELLAEVQRLKEIVRKLLLLAQADSGRMCLSPQRLQPAGMVAAACDDLRAIAASLQLRLDLAEDVAVMADADLLNQMLLNLLGNAFKFNDARGMIEVVLRAAPPWAVFTIANTGPGIAAKDQPRLFERFYRADKSRGRQVDGTGLGLSLAREIARAHGGDLTLTRSDEQLTVFSLILPLAGEARGESNELIPACALKRP